MRIGILQCDSVAPDLQPAFGDYPDMLHRLLTMEGRRPECPVYALPAGQFPGSPRECDAWLFTGSTSSVYDGDVWIARAHELVRELHAERRPTIGLCFGHQLIARALGGSVDKASCGLGVGIHTIRIREPRAWMDPPRETLALLVSHQDQVMRLPPRAQWLASHDFCPHDMFVVDDHMLGLQAHPEFSRGYSRATMDRWRSLIGEAGFHAGVASLDGDIDSDIAARWIHGFLDQAGV